MQICTGTYTEKPTMGYVRPYDRDAAVQLLERAFQRSPHRTLRDFAREELVRDESTVRGYKNGQPIPRVVRDKLEKLARRRRPSRAQ